MSKYSAPTIIEPSSESGDRLSKTSPNGEIRVAPRRRGRPRKIVVDDGTEKKPKRRGRPRKPDAKYPTVADMKAFRRKWSMIDMMLHSSEGVTVEEMADHFDVTQRTIRRDLKILDDIFGGLDGRRIRRGQRRYSLERIPFGDKGSAITRDELISICIARQLMLPLGGTKLSEAMDSGCEKIRSCLSKESVEYADRVVSFFQQLNDSKTVNEENSEVLNILLSAMTDGIAVEILYGSARSQEDETFKALPYGVIYDKGFVYLAGYSCNDEEERIWKLNRIKQIKTSETKFYLPEDFSMDKFASNAITPYLGKGKPRRVRVCFKPEVAVDIEELAMTVAKRKRWKKNGSLEVEMKIDPNPSFINWVMGFGKSAEITYPPDLRWRFLKEIEALASKYR